MKISHPEHGGNGESTGVVNQWLLWRPVDFRRRFSPWDTPWGTPACAGPVQTGSLADLCRRLQFTDEPANISGFHRIRRYDDFFDMIAFGAIEGAKFESSRPQRDARKCHARSAFRAV